MTVAFHTSPEMEKRSQSSVLFLGISPKEGGTSLKRQHRSTAHISSEQQGWRRLRRRWAGFSTGSGDSGKVYVALVSH